MPRKSCKPSTVRSKELQAILKRFANLPAAHGRPAPNSLEAKLERFAKRCEDVVRDIESIEDRFAATNADPPRPVAGFHRCQLMATTITGELLERLEQFLHNLSRVRNS